MGLSGCGEEKLADPKSGREAEMQNRIVNPQPQPREIISFRSQTKKFLVPLGIAFGLGWPLVVAIPYLNDLRVLHISDNVDPLTWKQYVAIVIMVPLMYLSFCFLFLSLPQVGSYR